jgi:hypothetical protein
LYELLVGVLPFDPKALRRAGFDEIRRIIREEEAPRPTARLRSLAGKTAEIAAHRRTDPRGLERQLRGDLDWITTKAMEKERARRYASASELAADIERHLRDEPVLASRKGAVYRFSKFVRKHRGAVTGTLIAVLSLAVTLGLSATVELRNDIQREFDLTLQGAQTVNKYASGLVVYSINRQPAMPLRMALSDPDLKREMSRLLRDLLLAPGWSILRIDVIDVYSNEILLDSAEQQGGIYVPYPDFYHVASSSGYNQLHVLLNGGDYEVVTRPWPLSDSQPLFAVRTIISAEFMGQRRLIRNSPLQIIIVPITSMLRLGILPASVVAWLLMLCLLCLFCLTCLLSISWMWWRR